MTYKVAAYAIAILAVIGLSLAWGAAGDVYIMRVSDAISPGTAEFGSGDDTVVRTVELKPSTVALIKDSMWGVVNEAGTGVRARIEGQDVCAKTGTAQVYRVSRDIDAHKLPKDKRDHAWFVGFAPADDPKIVVAVMVEFGEHGYFLHSTPHEETLRVPLIVHAPGQALRQDVTSFTGNVDLLPTFLRIANQATTYDLPSTIEGRILPGLGLDDPCASAASRCFATSAATELIARDGLR